MRLLIAGLTGLLIAAPVSGQEDAATGYAVSALLGAGSVDSKFGALFGVGGSAETSWAILRLLFDLHLRASEDSDYAWKAVTTSGPECRNKRTSEVVPDSWCTLSRAMLGLSGDVSFKVAASPGAVYLGGGFRGGDGATPYGTVGYGYGPRTSNWRLLVRGVAGQDLVQLQAIASIPVGFGRK